MVNTEKTKPWAEKSVSVKVRPDVKLAFDAYCQDHGRARSGAAAWLIERFLIEQGYFAVNGETKAAGRPPLPVPPARQSRAPMAQPAA